MNCLLLKNMCSRTASKHDKQDILIHAAVLPSV